LKTLFNPRWKKYPDGRQFCDLNFIPAKTALCLVSTLKIPEDFCGAFGFF
jgi:hypothetical protein